MSEDDELQLLDDDEDEASITVSPWVVLVADDEQDVHDVTEMLLAKFEYQGRPLQLLHTYSGEETCATFAERSDIALVLLDVVMESDDAGLKAVEYIRQTLGNTSVRIVLRTGQPGVAPERSVVTNFDIDDYREKTELTSARLNSIIYTGLRSFDAYTQLAVLNHELQTANRDLEQFSYLASHDLKAPLRQVASFVKLLKRNLGEDLSEENASFMEFIDEGVSNMTRLLEDLLALSRVGRVDGELAEVDCEKALDEALQNLQGIVDERGAVVSREPLPTFNGSYRYMVQFFQNLISNGIKFQDGDAPAISIQARDEKNEWIISVRDQGIGIAEEHMDQIFAPFRRLHTSEQYEGTGIGLAICKKVADFHGGKVWAESEPGQGTTMFLSVPKKASLTQTD